jgi:hypothetical protein
MEHIVELRQRHGILTTGRELQPYFIAPLVTGRSGLPVG